MRTLLLSAVFAAMVSLTAFGTPPSVVLVQFHYFEHLITVTRGAGKTESMQTLSPTSKNHVANAEQLQALFAKLSKRDMYFRLLLLVAQEILQLK